MRKQWQKACYNVIRPPPAPGAVRRLRRRLDRWALQILPGRRVDRAVRLLRGLAVEAPPRVWAAVLRTLCNGWVTARRFQTTGNCVLGCENCNDSIEHYAYCGILPHFVNVTSEPQQLNHHGGLRSSSRSHPPSRSVLQALWCGVRWLCMRSTPRMRRPDTLHSPLLSTGRRWSSACERPSAATLKLQRISRGDQSSSFSSSSSLSEFGSFRTCHASLPSLRIGGRGMKLLAGKKNPRWTAPAFCGSK